MNRIEIRAGGAEDDPAIEALYPDAFPDENLLPLVRQLWHGQFGVLSLVALLGNDLSGHVLFTPCALEGCDDRLALLGPLAVAPHLQRQGVGTALVGAGLRQLGQDRVTRVCVLSDPAYYGRFGFGCEDLIYPPYPLPAAWRTAWQSLRLRDGLPACSGTLVVPQPWRERALWAP